MPYCKDEDALSPEEEQLAREIADARIAAMREREMTIPDMNENELKAFRQFLSIVRNDPQLPKPPAVLDLFSPAEVPAPQDKPEPWTAVLTLSPAERTNVFTAIRAELAVIEKNAASVLSGDTTMTAALKAVIETANKGLEEMAVMTAGEQNPKGVKEKQ
ncbi:MAG: hypothetical protein LBG57_05885 [Treponema sp.]|jgi:hypothetical protein|nr:hypothetical protein [Treponema sp.]